MTSESVRPQVPSHRQPAPGDLEAVRAFVNTLDVEDGVDQLDTPDALREWLSAQIAADPCIGKPTAACA